MSGSIREVDRGWRKEEEKRLGLRRSMEVEEGMKSEKGGKVNGFGAE